MCICTPELAKSFIHMHSSYIASYNNAGLQWIDFILVVSAWH